MSLPWRSDEVTDFDASSGLTRSMANDLAKSAVVRRRAARVVRVDRF